MPSRPFLTRPACSLSSRASTLAIRSRYSASSFSFKSDFIERPIVASTDASASARQTDWTTVMRVRAYMFTSRAWTARPSPHDDGGADEVGLEDDAGAGGELRVHHDLRLLVLRYG